MPVSTVRIALCLNGGVSLAVWMSGVVHELDLVARASRGEDFPADYAARPCGARERAHFDAWREFCREHDVRVVVDVVAGTSAGGLNGAILAKSLAYGAPLPDLRELWADCGALEPGKLLPGPDADPVASVLDGGFFQDTITDVLASITPPDPLPDPLPPTTLFLTATALGTADRRYRDAAGTAFDVPDHRRLYRFRSAPRQDLDPATGGFHTTRDDDFVGDTPHLALAARASAGFPVAFAPVEETPELAALARPRRRPGDGPLLLMDGGVLDNAPLQPILAETGTRRADGRISRAVVYVVPSSGVVNRAPRAPETGPLGWPQIAGSGLMFPREADFRADIDDLVQSLDESRVRITAARTLLHAALRDPAALTQLRDGRASLEEPYRRTRVLGTIAEVRSELAARGLLVPKLGSSEPQPLPDSLRARWALGTETGWPYGITGALRTVRILLSTVRELICATTDEAESQTLTGVADTLGLAADRIDALHRAVAEALYADKLSSSEEPGDEDIVAAVNVRFDELGLPDRLDDLIEDAVGAYVGGVGGDSKTLRAALEAIEVVTGALAARSEDQSPPAFRFVRLGPEIEHETFDGPDLGDDKLYGTRLMNFAAFGHREWRMWDWTWGRLDAAAHITRLLTSRDPGSAIERFEQQILAAEGSSVVAVEEGLARIRADLVRDPGSKDAGLLDLLRSDADGLMAINGVVESVLRVLGQDQGVPEWLHRVLRLVRTLLTARARQRIGARARLLRIVATPVRSGFWRFVRKR